MVLDNAVVVVTIEVSPDEVDFGVLTVDRVHTNHGDIRTGTIKKRRSMVNS